MSMSITLADLEAMDHGELTEVWNTRFEAPPPRRLSAALMRRILAYDIQAKRHGALSRRTRERLLRVARSKTRTTSPALAPGGRLVREWNGHTHVVEVLEAGFRWRGETYRSLSAVAEAITGARWSGPRFFGLRKPAS